MGFFEVELNVLIAQVIVRELVHLIVEHLT